MAEKYRKMTRAEYEALFQKKESDLVIAAREYVSRNYPETAYKVFVRPNCEYDDNYYNLSPTIIVLDMNMEEVLPSIHSTYENMFDIFRSANLVIGWEYKVKDPIDNFSFFMVEEKKSIPELYIRIA